MRMSILCKWTWVRPCDCFMLFYSQTEEAEVSGANLPTPVVWCAVPTFSTKHRQETQVITTAILWQDIGTVDVQIKMVVYGKCTKKHGVCYHGTCSKSISKNKYQWAYINKTWHYNDTCPKPWYHVIKPLWNHGACSKTCKHHVKCPKNMVPCQTAVVLVQKAMLKD